MRHGPKYVICCCLRIRSCGLAQGVSPVGFCLAIIPIFVMYVRVWQARGLKGEEAEKARIACWHHFDQDSDGMLSVFELLRGSAPDLDALLSQPPTWVVSTQQLCGKEARYL